MVAISVAAGVVAARSGAAPTGDPNVDAVLLVVAVGICTWLGAAALRWDAAVLALAAAATSWTPVGATLGVATAIVGYGVPISRAYRGVVTAAMVGIALNIAARSQLDVIFGLSVIVFLTLAASIASVGARRRPRSVRRIAFVTLGAAGALALLATAALAVFGALAAGDVRLADDHARRGLTALGDGDLDAARTAFADAADAFDRADARVDHPVTAVAGLVPGVAQHRRVATELTSGGADVARTIVAQLGAIDLDALSVDAGRIDIDAVRDLRRPLATVEREIARLQATIAGIDSPWLVPPLADELDGLATEVAEQRQRSYDALSVALAAPAILGADGPRTYFIGFTTPAEARGIGGFMGNWGEVTVSDGRIELTGFGRSDDLEEAGDPATRRFTTSDSLDTDEADPRLDEWLARYGPYNLNSGPGGTTGPSVWKNINMSPDMATTGRAIADLYPQSGGRELDGVFIVDVFALARLLEFTGPIELPDGQVIAGRRSLDVDTAADFLLKDLYNVRRDERIVILEEFSRTVIDRLLDSPLPSPADLLDVMGPMVDQGRFTGWAARASEQDLLDQIGMSGTLAPLDVELDSDALAIAFNNASGNKIDYFLEASGSYTVTADATRRAATAELVVELTNNAPTTGEPYDVIGNLVGLPEGSNRTWVSIFSRLPMVDVRINDRPAAFEVGTEAGYYVTSAFVTLESGDSATLTLSMAGRLDVADGYEVAVRTPPAVTPMPMQIDATWIDGDGGVHREVEERRDPGLAHITVDAER